MSEIDQGGLQMRLPLINERKLVAETGFTRWVEFHEYNPQVFATILKISMELKNLGFQNGSINLIFERMRWLYAIQTRGDKYKLNNNYRAFYARLAMEVEPRLFGFFRIRSQRLSDEEKREFNVLVRETRGECVKGAI